MQNPNVIMNKMEGNGLVGMSLGAFGSMIVFVIKFILYSMSFYTLAFLRYRYGERQLNFIIISLAWLFAYLLSGDIFLIGGWFEIVDADSIVIFYRHLWLFYLVSILHLLHLRIRTRVFNERWYSRNRGVSILYKVSELIGLANRQIRMNGRALFTLRQHTFWKYIEPGIVIFAGLLYMRAGIGFYGTFLLLSGICIFISSQMAYSEFRGKILNILDGKIEGDFISGLPETGIVGEKTLEAYYGIDDYGAIHSREELAQLSTAISASRLPVLNEAELNPV